MDGEERRYVILKCADRDYSKSYFKFENWWIEVDGLKEGISLWGNSFEL